MSRPTRAQSETAVLVEGRSDRIAVLTLAKRLDRDLADEGVSVVAMHGATNFRRHLIEALDSGLAVAGLCDEAEEVGYRLALEMAGLGEKLTRPAMEALGFFVCVADLEEELISAAGVDLVERVIADEGELESLRILQNQPAWRGRAPVKQLRRFMGSKSGRKARYGRLLVDAIDVERMPRPLLGLVQHV